MSTIKSYTDLEQSRKLAEILPLESADMKWFVPADNEGEFIEGVSLIENKSEYALFDKVTDWNDTPYLPCWSLAALLEQLPYELCDDDGNSSYLQINKEDDVYQLIYADPYGEFENIETDRHEHFVDACYEMILKLKELNLL